jgi:hypothetical protein
MDNSVVWPLVSKYVEIRVGREVSVPNKTGGYEALVGRSITYVIERGSDRLTGVVGSK